MDTVERRSIGRKDAAYALLAFAGVVGAGLLLPPAEALFGAAFWVLVVLIMRSDLDHFIIPDSASASILALGLVHTIVVTPYGETLDALLSACGLGVGTFLLFYIVHRAYRALRGHDGLGFGDVKLAGACAVWLDVAGAAAALQLASLSAGAVLLCRTRDRSAAIPYGAFLAPAAWLVMVANRLWPSGTGGFS